MTDRNYKRKFQYFESFIGLILSIIFISIIMVNKLVTKETCIYIGYLNKKELKSAFYPYSLSVPPKRNYETLTIRGESDSAINELSKLVVPIYQYRDTLTGVKIIFDKSIKYRQYIETINVLLKARANVFAPLEDTIFVFYLNRYKKHDTLGFNLIH